MTELATLLQTKKTPIRVHKPLSKPVKCLSPFKDSITSHLSEGSTIRSSFSSPRFYQKKIKQKADFQFSLCASKDVFAFSRKYSPVKQKKTAKYHQQQRDQQIHKLFCARNQIKRPLYRTNVRSHTSKRQKIQDICQRKISSSQTNIAFFTINPEPWQISGEGHQLQDLL